MMNFLSIFRTQIPDIIKRLNDVKTELNITKNNINHLLIVEKEMSERDMNESDQSQLVEMAVDNFEVAMWLKDLNGRFVFANKACCDNILKCSLEKVLNMKDDDFKRNALAQICMRTDLEVIKHKTTKRWIEFALYEDGRKVFVDTIKSPVFNDVGEITGVVGNAVDITESIPDVIKNQNRESNSIEIPVDTTLNRQTFADLLERRSKPRE